MKAEKLTVEREIERVLKAMNEISINSEEYAIDIKMLKELNEMRCKRLLHFIEPEILMALTSLLEVLLILNHEQLHVISSKALGLIKRI